MKMKDAELNVWTFNLESNFILALPMNRPIRSLFTNCFVSWPLNESEAEVDLVLIETSWLFLCKFLLIIM